MRVATLNKVVRTEAVAWRSYHISLIRIRDLHHIHYLINSRTKRNWY